MSNVTDDPIAWDDIDLSIQKSISAFYYELWTKEAINFCAKQIKTIKRLHGKACLNSQIGKAYLLLEWNHGEKESQRKVVIEAFPLDCLLDQLTGDDNKPSFPFLPSSERSALLQTMDKILNQDKIFVYSFDNGAFSHEEKDESIVFYEENGIEHSVHCKGFPFRGTWVSFDDSVVSEVNEREKKRKENEKKEGQETEQLREDALYDWLRIQGVGVERQVKTSSSHIIDLWIPDSMMIEIKRASVTGNDICQCMEYASEYRLPIVLVGDKISGAASRGIKGFNHLCPDHKILFISWDAIYDFLRGKLDLGKRS